MAKMICQCGDSAREHKRHYNPETDKNDKRGACRSCLCVQFNQIKN